MYSIIAQIYIWKKNNILGKKILSHSIYIYIYRWVKSRGLDTSGGGGGGRRRKSVLSSSTCEQNVIRNACLLCSNFKITLWHSRFQSPPLDITKILPKYRCFTASSTSRLLVILHNMILIMHESKLSQKSFPKWFERWAMVTTPRGKV